MSKAIEPSTCICVVMGFVPITGRRKLASVHFSAFGFATCFFAAAAAAFAARGFSSPVVDGPPPAGTLVIVEAALAARRAGALDLEPKSPLNQPPSADFGFVACTFAMSLSPARV